MLETKFLVIGAGISGLSFASRINSDDYIICEADKEIGGYCKTIKQDGFTWDYSGHFFHFKRPDIEQYLVDNMDAQKIFKVQKESKIYWKEGWVDFPFQKNIHQLPKDDFIDCIHGLHFRPKSDPTNFKDMLYSKFGKGISEKFLIPYNEKLYATDLENLDLNAMGRFFPYADTDQIINNFKNPDNDSYNNTFTYPEGGAIEYVKALAKNVDKKKILLNEKVLSVDSINKTAQTTHRRIKYQHIVSSAPLIKLLELVGLEYHKPSFTYNKVLVFNLGFDKKGVDQLHWAYFPQKDLCFYRVGFYDNIMDQARLSMYVEIGLNNNVELSNADIKNYKDEVISDLKKSGLIIDHELVSWHQVVMDPAYVHITEESIKETLRVKKVLVNQNIHSIGRYGSWTYCSIEDNIIEAWDLADNYNALA